ncbi:UNVERIFIED_CONTAM: hypothetical protein RF648_19875, partial [Kocuria sp. CPCC 205274]
EMQHTTSRRNAFAQPDGYYLATVANLNGVGQRAILWLSNGRYYRHGWNHPIPSQSVSGATRIGSVSLEGGSTINLDFVTQE